MTDTSPDLARHGRVLAVGGVLVALLLAWTVRGFAPEQTWSNLRYADHLARGLGPVWNEGGPRVEGFPAPLLVLSEALLGALGIDALAVARAAGLVALLATLRVIWRQGRALFEPLAAGIGTLLAGATPALAFWAVTGLETAVVTLLVTTVMLDAVRSDGASPLRAGALLALLPWLRPEGPLLASFYAACAVMARPNPRSRVVPTCAPVVVSILVLLCVRGTVFGAWLPNSAHFRFGASNPNEAFLELAAHLAPLFPFFVLGTALAGRRGIALAAPVVATLVFAPAYMDQLSEFGRHLLPVWPLVCLGAGAGVAAFSRTNVGTPLLAPAVALALGCAVLVTPGGSAHEVADFADEHLGCRQVVRRGAGAFLRTELAPAQVYGVSDAGLVSYVAGGQSLDLFGINDASFKTVSNLDFAGRAAAALARSPDWLVLRGGPPADTLVPRYAVERELVLHPSFPDLYTNVRVVSVADCDYSLWIFRRR